MGGMMTGDGTAMMTGMLIVWVLAVVVLVMIAGAAIKYLFFHKNRKD